MFTFQDLFIELGLSSRIAGELSFLILFLMFSVGFGMLIGRFRLINVLINVYIAIAILTVLPVGVFSDSSLAVFFIFVATVLILTLVDSHLFDIHIAGSGGSFFWRLFVMSFFEAGLIFSQFLSFLEKSILADRISISAYELFASFPARLFWMITPLIVLFFINKKEK